MFNGRDNVDLVYRWINPSCALGRVSQKASAGATECLNRYRDNNELKYSLRSVAKYATWVDQIHILGEGAPPDWLIVGGPIVWIDLEDFFKTNRVKPQPNSETQKLLFSKIPKLAEKFICFDDDYFLGRSVVESEYFSRDGRPIHPCGDHAPIAWTKTLYDQGLAMLPSSFMQLIETAGTARWDPMLKMREVMMAEDLLLTSQKRDVQIWLRDTNVGRYREVLQEIEDTNPQTYCINDDWSCNAVEYDEQMSVLQSFFERQLPNPALWEYLSM